jgi:hypothetical protein
MSIIALEAERRLQPMSAKPNRTNIITPKQPKAINLYKFIKLVLNPMPDSHIARRWNMDVKNFHELKIGNLPVPQLWRLKTLAAVLKVNRHLVYEVAEGKPAGMVFNLIKNNNKSKIIKLLGIK